MSGHRLLLNGSFCVTVRLINVNIGATLNLNPSMSKSLDKYNTDQFWHWTSISDHINYGINVILYRLINVNMFAQIIFLFIRSWWCWNPDRNFDHIWWLTFFEVWLLRVFNTLYGIKVITICVELFYLHLLLVTLVCF